MRAGTIHFFFYTFCFIVPIMHHIWKYRTGSAVQVSVCVVWSVRQFRTDHAYVSTCVCVLFIVLHLPLSLTSVCTPAPRANLMIKRTVGASGGGGETGRISPPKISLSTAIKILFFRGIPSCVPVIEVEPIKGLFNV